MTAGCEEDLFGADGLFLTIVEDDFNFVFGEEVRTTVDVFDFVVVEVPFVDAVKLSYIVVSFAFECLEVEGGGFFDLKAIGCGFVEGFGDGGGVPGDFLGYAAGWLSVMFLGRC